ncbi:nicotinate-nucleotide--dimethylbenzimidazole phosphoribosyltransferase [Carnimonas nigrificans]|uniref:nicotinate-nucleotide--dimethylbenzimidazole phosphoribosyltransferase n=1 Tax=Carnimonas nigrificans TaxID=64323 RepID=UPI0004B61340|nr:nicotinate-nucleotide--dimethylbenzimidazole phosphoribosyltransferase [Carnimonas nigrificans]
MPTATLPNTLSIDIPWLEHAVPGEQRNAIQQRIDSRLKPPGALGALENIMRQWACCACLRGESGPLRVTSPRLMIFAADHGVAAEGVSLVGSEFTPVMVTHFLAGDAAVGVAARQANVALEVVDCGVVQPLPADPRVTACRLGAGTVAIHQAPAMTLETAAAGIANGIELARKRCEAGMDLLCVGEMGIGNTTAAAALMAGLTGYSSAACTGVGTGINTDTLAHKRALIDQALALHLPLAEGDPLALAARLGGFEIITMAGALLGAAEQGVISVIDGFVAGVAACLACALVPSAKDYLIFAHCGSEQGHSALLEYLDVKALMELQLRIGEGVGGVLLVPTLRTALACYNEMASVTDAGLSL